VQQSIAHVALVVRDYDEALAWYVGKLGFRLVEDTVLLEVKQGPYSGVQEKDRF